MEFVVSEPESILRDFRQSPDPPSLNADKYMPSTVPIDLRLQNPTLSEDIGIPQKTVSKRVVEGVQDVFGLDDVELLEEKDENVSGDETERKNSTSTSNEWLPTNETSESDENYVAIEIENTNMHSLLLHHALLGFTFGSAPFCIRTLLLQALPSPSGKFPSEVAESRASQFDDSAEQFKLKVLVFNVYALSTFLSVPSGWAFTIALEPSPYYGLNGLEARMCVQGPSKKLLSFHLTGISRLSEDLCRLDKLLKTIHSTSRLQLLGVVTNLDEKQYATQLGDVVSVVTEHFARHAPRTLPFCTPRSASARRPPLLPAELADTSVEDMEKLVSKYRNMLEVSWKTEQIDELTRQHALLKSEPRENFSLLSDSAAMSDEEPKRMTQPVDDFVKGWERIGSRYDKLHEFAGGLATAFLYAPKPRRRPGITAMEHSDEDKTFDSRDQAIVSREAADVVLHACQFQELRHHYFLR